MRLATCGARESRSIWRAMASNPAKKNPRIEKLGKNLGKTECLNLPVVKIGLRGLGF